MFITEFLASVAALIWLVTALLPWQAWRNREILVGDSTLSVDLKEITVVIPARNEATVIANTLSAFKGVELPIILIDDDSSDATVTVAQEVGLKNLKIIHSSPLPQGWSGKLWAQEQGLKAVKTELTLLLDADIYLQTDTLLSLRAKQQQGDFHFVSLMALLKIDSFWEKLLMPAFIYFFKMLYPFYLVNKTNSQVAAAAGGCILVKTQVLHEIGGMASIKEAVIDDCSLAKKVKQAGYKIWIGLTHGAISQRPYHSLGEIWDMVARTAYTQLFYSKLLLFACTLVMLLMYVFPLWGIFFTSGWAWQLSFIAWCLMLSLYLPTLRFYGLNGYWAIGMPVIAGLYLLMTWTSALRYWQGERSRWKGRIYQKG